jgi:hypothetical protein
MWSNFKYFVLLSVAPFTNGRSEFKKKSVCSTNSSELEQEPRSEQGVFLETGKELINCRNVFPVCQLAS